MQTNVWQQLQFQEGSSCSQSSFRLRKIGSLLLVCGQVSSRQQHYVFIFNTTESLLPSPTVQRCTCEGESDFPALDKNSNWATHSPGLLPAHFERCGMNELITQHVHPHNNSNYNYQQHTGLTSLLLTHMFCIRSGGRSYQSQCKRGEYSSLYRECCNVSFVFICQGPNSEYLAGAVGCRDWF